MASLTCKQHSKWVERKHNTMSPPPQKKNKGRKNKEKRGGERERKKEIRFSNNWKLCWIQYLCMKVSDVFLQIAFLLGSNGTEWTLEMRFSSTLFSLMSYQWCLPLILFTTRITHKFLQARCWLTSKISWNTIMFGLPLVIHFKVERCSCKENKRAQ